MRPGWEDVDPVAPGIAVGLCSPEQSGLTVAIPVGMAVDTTA